MKKTALLTLAILCPLTLGSCNTTTQTLSNDIASLGNVLFKNVNLPAGRAAALPREDIAAAFKQALSIGTSEVVQQLGQPDGFNLDPKVHIPLPANLAKVQDVLNKAGMSYLLDDLETRLNKAAEIATPHAKELFVQAISDMSFDDVISIYKGPQDSATRFFEGKMSAPLAQKMAPFVKQAISQAGVVNAYDNVISQYRAIPFLPDVKTDLTDYVVDEGIGGIFYYLGQQEKAIRQDPAKQTTALLKRVFGTKG